eukprot:2408555-Alexandrium_andersonii.AAC.1
MVACSAGSNPLLSMRSRPFRKEWRKAVSEMSEHVLLQLLELLDARGRLRGAAIEDAHALELVLVEGLSLIHISEPTRLALI